MNHHAHRQMHGSRPHQRGAALIVALVMLLVLTLIAVTASRTSTLQERMAGNLRQSSLAFEAAESTLRIGEEWIENQIGGPRPVAVTVSGCGSPPCEVLVLDELDPFDYSAAWGSSNVHDTAETPYGTAAPPEYFIEEQQVVRDSLNVGMSTDTAARHYYRITARAVGGTTSAESILRSSYAARF